MTDRRVGKAKRAHPTKLKPASILVPRKNGKTLNDQYWKFVVRGYVTPLTIFLLGDIHESFSVRYSSSIRLPTDAAPRMNSRKCRNFRLIPNNLLGRKRIAESKTTNNG
jgi:hypothetical protein